MATKRDNLTRARENTGGVTGIVFNIQRYSIQDGPGIRTTIFLKGCPLRCLWCSNPESQSLRPEIAHRDSLCTRCGRCLDVCPVHAVSLKEKGVVIDQRLCTDCGRCVTVCIPGALKIFGEEMTAAEAFQEVKRDVEFFRESGGGVTVSGGEPLSQADFVTALFRLCRDAGIDTCIETCGLAGVKALKKVLPFTSLVLFDIKLTDPAAHREWTGRSNEEIMHNLKVIVASGTPVIIRVPLIPGINDSEVELRKICRIAAGFPQGPIRVNILPYHKFGMGKYQMLDREYELEELNSQTDKEMQQAKQLFESCGLECEVVG